MTEETGTFALAELLTPDEIAKLDAWALVYLIDRKTALRRIMVSGLHQAMTRPGPIPEPYPNR